MLTTCHKQLFSGCIERDQHYLMVSLSHCDNTATSLWPHDRSSTDVPDRAFHAPGSLYTWAAKTGIHIKSHPKVLLHQIWQATYRKAVSSGICDVHRSAWAVISPSLITASNHAHYGPHTYYQISRCAAFAPTWPACVELASGLP